MSLYLLQGAIEEGFIYALVALGLFVSYRILKIADMTTDGSFVLGAAVSTMFVINGHPVLALFASMIAGAISGLFTALLQTVLGIPSILAGIITMTGLYTINLLVQGGVPNIYFANEKTVFDIVPVPENLAVIITLVLLVALVCILLTFFFKTRIGLSVRATGDNPEMVQASSINPRVAIAIGLAISNAFVALSGALLAQKNHQGDIKIGAGIVVIGLASLVLGSIVFRKASVFSGLLAAVFGAVVYRVIYSLAVRHTSDASYLKLVSACILIIVMAYPTVKNKIIQHNKYRKERKKYADAK